MVFIYSKIKNINIKKKYFKIKVKNLLNIILLYQVYLKFLFINSKS